MPVTCKTVFRGYGGENENGELGLGFCSKFEERPTKVVIPCSDRIIDMSMSHSHILLLGGSGSVYGIGCNNSGQLGTGGETYCQKTTGFS